MNRTVKYQGAFSRIVGFAGKRFLFSTPPPYFIFLLPLQLSRYNSTGNACYAGYPKLFFRVCAAFSYVWSISFIYKFIRLPHVIKLGDMLYYVSKGNFSVVPTPQFKTHVRYFRIVLWISLYGANLALLPTIYFRCPMCRHLCLWLGVRSQRLFFPLLL